MVTRRSLLQGAGATLAAGAGVSVAATGFTARSSLAEPLFELRSYAMRPGRRDDIVAMFEAVFLDAYERGGARVLGTFRTPDDPDRWIWIRAFADAAARGPALAAFYGSKVWRTRARAVNATIADTSDVVLLRAVAGDLAVGGRTPGPPAAAAVPDSSSAGVRPGSMIECRVQIVAPRCEAEFARHWLEVAVPRLGALGAAPFAVLATDRRPNSYPRQPVRDDSVVVTLTRFPSLEAHADACRRRDADPDWRERIEPSFSRLCIGAPETRRLLPTRRSELR